MANLANETSGYNIVINSNTAKKHGLNESVVLLTIAGFIHSFKMQGIPDFLKDECIYYDNRYWVKCSIKLLHEKLNFFSQTQIYRIIKKLENKELIKKEQFNKKNYDLTNFYTVIEENI